MVNSWRECAARRKDRLAKLQQCLAVRSARDHAVAVHAWQRNVRVKDRIRCILRLKRNTTELLRVSTLFHVWTRECFARVTVKRAELRRSMKSVAKHFLGVTSRGQMWMSFTEWRGWARVRGIIAHRYFSLSARGQLREALVRWNDATRLSFKQTARRAKRQIERLHKSLTAATKGEETLAQMANDLQAAFGERDALQAALQRGTAEADEERKRMNEALAAAERAAEAQNGDKDALKDSLSKARDEQWEARQQAEAALKERDTKIAMLETRVASLEAELAKARTDGPAPPSSNNLAPHSNKVNVGTSTGLTPVATLSVDTSGQLVQAQFQ